MGITVFIICVIIASVISIEASIDYNLPYREIWNDLDKAEFEKPISDFRQAHSKDKRFIYFVNPNCLLYRKDATEYYIHDLGRFQWIMSPIMKYNIVKIKKYMEENHEHVFESPKG